MGEREQLAADIRAALDGASPGPWSQTGADVERSLGDYSQVVGTMDMVRDAAFVAAAPELLRRALDVLEPDDGMTDTNRRERCPRCGSEWRGIYLVDRGCSDRGASHPWHFGGEQ